MFRNKKLIWQIFPSFLLITLISLGVVTWYSSIFFKNFFLENVEKDLTIRLKLAKRELSKHIITSTDKTIIEKENFIALNNVLKEISTQVDTRFTIILSSGKVIADSGADIKEFENHKNRPEIQHALIGEKGISVRFSSTLNTNMMYIALPVLKDNKNLAVIRASLSISSIDNKIKSIQKKIFLALAITIMIAAGVSLYVSRRITRPLEEMKSGALNFANGNLQQRLSVPDSEELGELALTMNNMATNLDDKIKAVQNRKTELETIYSSMEEGVIAINNDERIITINKAGAKIFDFPLSMLEKRNIFEISRNITLQDFFKKALATHEPVEEILTVNKTKEYILNIHSSALYDAHNNRLGTLIIFHDITRIKLLENMHKDFAANVSHELKTPLTAIRGFVETLQNMDTEQAHSKNIDFLQIIEKNAIRMTAIIDDLLSLSQLERMENDDKEFKLHDLVIVIDRGINECRTITKQKQITIKKNCPDKLMAAIDPLLIEQTIINLIDNAIKYSQNNSEVIITAKEDEECAIIKVKDSGTGIQKEHFSKIFNRFYRVDKARSRNTGGTGLGLAIVKHIAMYHNGSANVTSSEGKGSTFEIKFPIN